MKTPRHLLICLLLFTALVSINFFVGAVEDNDGYKIIKRALTAPWYTQSRTWGFPAYEIFAYPIIYYAGLTATKFYSFVFAIGSIIVFWAILNKVTNDSVKCFWGTLAFALLPVTIISGNSVMETSQGLFLALAGVLLYLRFERERKSRDFLLMALALGLATATRPDYIVLSGCVALVMLIFARPSLALIVLATLVWAAAALLPYTIYAISRVQFGLILPEPLWRKTARAVLGYLALFGIPAVVVMVAWLAMRRRSLARVPAHLWAFFGLTLTLYSARYVMLPDELEYVHLVFS